jgi:hypothetical protein
MSGRIIQVRGFYKILIQEEEFTGARASLPALSAQRENLFALNLRAESAAEVSPG